MTHWELSHPFLGSHQCHHPSPSLAFQLQLPLHLSLHLGLWLLWLHLIRAYALDQSIFVSLSSLPSGFLAFTASSENLFISLCSLTFVKTKTKFICVCVITFDLHVVADVHLLSFFQFHQFLTCEKKKKGHYEDLLRDKPHESRKPTHLERLNCAWHYAVYFTDLTLLNAHNDPGK